MILLPFVLLLTGCAWYGGEPLHPPGWILLAVLSSPAIWIIGYITGVAYRRLLGTQWAQLPLAWAWRVCWCPACHTKRLQVRCPDCQGLGEHVEYDHGWDEETRITCATCAGTGRRTLAGHS